MHGMGLFARRNLQKKDIICFYSGDVPLKNIKSKYIAEVKDLKGEIILIDGDDVKNFSGRWMNHSARPNARLVKPIGGILRYDKKHVILVECIKEIRKGDEIFVNYGIQYFIKRGRLDETFLYGLD